MKKESNWVLKDLAVELVVMMEALLNYFIIARRRCPLIRWLKSI